jgi:hypothetical protein
MRYLNLPTVQLMRTCVGLLALTSATGCTIGKLDLGQNQRRPGSAPNGSPTRVAACSNVPTTPTKLFATNAEEWASVKSIAVDATHVYLASNEAAVSNVDGVKVLPADALRRQSALISRIPLAGGQRELVDVRSSGSGLETIVLLDAKNMYWPDLKALRIRPKDLSGRRSVTAPSGVLRRNSAIDDSGKLYVEITSDSSNELWELEPGGSSLRLKHRAEQAFYRIAADSSGVYWIAGTGIYVMDAAARQPTRLDDERDRPAWSALALDKDHIYAALYSVGFKVVKRSKVGGAETTLDFWEYLRNRDDSADGRLSPFPDVPTTAYIEQLVVSDNGIYAVLTDRQSTVSAGSRYISWLARMDTNGRNGQMIAYGYDISNVVVDDCRIYWTQADATEDLVYYIAK